MLYTNSVKVIYLLFTISYLIFIGGATAATPTPKAGEVDVKAEVKGPSPGLSGSTTPTPSIASASPSVIKQTEEPAKKGEEAKVGGPKAEIQEQSGATESFVEEAIEEADNLLIKDNLWLILMALIWVIFIAIIVFLIFRRKKKKLEAQNIQIQTPGQTPGETTASEPRGSSSTKGSVKKTFVP